MTTAIQANILGDILKERERQDKLHPKFPAEQRMSILVEELGEFAQALNDGDLEHARKELIEFIAVGVRWYEHLTAE